MEKGSKSSMNSPLLHISEDGLNHQNDESERRLDDDDKIHRRKLIIEEIKKQLWLAGPLILVNLLQYCLQMISVMFVGHLGELPLAGASMATSFATVTGFSLLVLAHVIDMARVPWGVEDFTLEMWRSFLTVLRWLGMASSLETFCGQSYGAKQYHMLGIHMQRAMIILLLVSAPLAIIWANTGEILKFLGQDAEISAEAGKYAICMIPSLFAYGLLQCLNRFLQTQNVVFPMVMSSGIAALLHIAICWVLIFKVGFEIRGAAVANSISYWLNVLILMLYVKFSSSCSKSWTGFSVQAFHNIPYFLKLAIPSACMVCLEMWSFEMMVLLSGLLPNPKLETSVLSISLNTALTVWMIPFGLSGAGSTRVSNELGAGHPAAAKLAGKVGMTMAIIEGLLVGSSLILMRKFWGYAYSNEQEVVEYVANMLPLVAASSFLDGLQCILSGIARGCGWQKIGAYVNLGSYYIVGIPSAVLLGFFLHIGGAGLWLGLICALIVQALSLAIITIRTNWDQEAKMATERVYGAVIPGNVVS